MPLVRVNLLLDDATYKAVQSGALELCGMVKDQKHRVRKHLPTVLDSAKEGAVKAVDIVREHKTGLLIAGGVLLVGGAVAGTISYFTQRDKRKAKKAFGKSFNIYLEASQNGELTLEIIDDLINRLDELSSLFENEPLPIDLSAKQLKKLFVGIYDYTKRMANANNYNSQNISAPKRTAKSNFVDLKQYLEIQKQIISDAA